MGWYRTGIVCGGGQCRGRITSPHITQYCSLASQRLSIYYVPATVLGLGAAVVNKKIKIPVCYLSLRTYQFSGQLLGGTPPMLTQDPSSASRHSFPYIVSFNVPRYQRKYSYPQFIVEGMEVSNLKRRQGLTIDCLIPGPELNYVPVHSPIYSSKFVLLFPSYR